jgi:acetyl esterase
MPGADRSLRLRLRRAIAAVLGAGLLAGIAACAPTGSQSEFVESEQQPVYPQLSTDPDVPVIEDIAYSDRGGEVQYLDACFPGDAAIDDPAAAPRAAIVVVHGGSWRRGDKANLNWRAVCQWLATAGYVTVSINYRLAPAWSFPAQLDDVQDAVRWLRDPDIVDRYNIDPDRIGAFGGSAGGNLASLLGTVGTGDRADVVRVASVVDLSGPADLTEPITTTGGNDVDFAAVQLEFLGCDTWDPCATAAQASPGTYADASDPPFFVAHSIDEFIPLAQSERFVETLRDAGVDVEFVTVEGTAHSIAMLTDDMQDRILDFFARTLAALDDGDSPPEDADGGTAPEAEG